MQFVDTHCHLHFENYDADREEVLNDALKHNVTRLICVGCSLEDSRRAVEFAASHENVWATVGAHPHDGEDFMRHPDAAEILNKLSNLPKVVAIGEIGLDYFHSTTSKADQEKALRQQIEIALEKELPIVFHVRDAFSDFFKIIDSYQGIRGVVHSFSAHVEEVEKILEQGLYVGLNGIMTFTKDDLQLEAAKKVPLDKLLLETDAPFLTPKPYRGKRCEPKHVTLTAEFLANLRGESLEQIAEATTSNAIEFFKLEQKND